MHRLTSLSALWFVLATAACSGRSHGDDDDGTGDACGVDEDCPDGQRCASDGRCRDEDAGCLANETPCGPDQCCGPTQTCFEEVCLDCFTVACGEVCCEEGDTCVAAGCCPEARACEGICCGPAQTCLAGECVDDCGELARCGEAGEEICCAGGEVCYLGECTQPGQPCDEDSECPVTEYCEDTLGRCLTRGDVDPDCEYQPPIGDFDPIIEWVWDGTGSDEPNSNQVMVPPMVANLDDELDGVGVPEIVFTSFTGSNYGGDGVLRALHGDTGEEYWSVTDDSYQTSGGATPAIGDIDADGELDIVTCAGDNGSYAESDAIAFEHDGSFKWRSNDSRVHCGWGGPVLADLDGDGSSEVIIRYAVLDAAGEVLWAGRSSSGAWMPDDYPTVADVDGDGSPDVVGGNIVYDADGGVIWDALMDGYGDGYPAIADVDLDGDPDVVVVSGSTLRAHEGASGDLLWGPVNFAAGRMSVVANFDDDDFPEVGVPDTYNYYSIDADSGQTNWSMTTQDMSGLAGSSVFDFDGDESAEVVYADETRLRVFRGSDGVVLFDRCNTSGTLWEYPVIVDVDADDHAEIVVSANNTFIQTCADGSPGPHGIQVFGESNDNWVRTRRIWNQHAYHVTNVEDDGSIPRQEENNWEIAGLNNFRQQTQLTGILDAADLVATDLTMETDGCPATVRLWARIRNGGAAGAMPGASVAFYLGEPPDGSLIGTTETTARLLPGESELVYVDFTLPEELQAESFRWYVVADDDGSGDGRLNECHEDNNVGGPVETTCPGFG
ncbi:MAG: hypothetical protein HYY06_22625 [Deltaproteobacteria bacterium]|nr:hypothetical protein [Deltaproteobacteria bacterium]